MKTAYSMVLSICLLSCLTQPKIEKSSVAAKNNDTVITTIYPPLIKQIRQLNEDTYSIHWYGGGLFSLCFERNKVSFFYTSQCIY